MTEKELFLTALLGCKREDLYTNHYSLNKQQQDNLLSMKKRRKISEPIQYITGFTEFMGFHFKVDKRVLIPRQETEILVEQTAALIKSYSSDRKLNVLDLCTGSGNIAICLAKLTKGHKISASDISEEALDLAKENTRLNKVEEKINFLKSDLFAAGFKEKVNFFDIIVCNPPYLTSSELDNSAIELSYEPRIALDAGNDGLLFYRKIIMRSPRYLKKNGLLIFEIGYNQLGKIKQIVGESKEFSIEKIVKDYSGIDRVIFLKKK
ncbi:MAG: peptide chain release factor N(5)-glutamine methyltransferase [Candidatus Omnitrophota bacterium]